MKNVRVEIHFHQPDVVSVFYESTAGLSDEGLTKRQFLSCYAARQITNLYGEVATKLANLLTIIPEDPDKLASFLRNYLGNMQNIQLVDYQGTKGRKILIAQMKEDKQGKITFSTKSKGFGLFGKGANYYFPISIIIIILFFTQQHSDNNSIKKIGKIANIIGTLYLKSHLKMYTNTAVALSIVQKIEESFSEIIDRGSK